MTVTPLPQRPAPTVEFALTYNARPWLINDENSGGSRGIGGRHGRSKLVKEWRREFGRIAQAEKVPPMDWMTVHVIQSCVDGRRPDLGGCMPAAKAGIDGIVDAGVIPDDNDRYVRGLSFAPALVTGYDALTLVLTGPLCSRAERKTRTVEAEAKLRGQFLRQTKKAPAARRVTRVR